jgi:hypothetical protein
VRRGGEREGGRRHQGGRVSERMHGFGGKRAE